MRVKISMCRRGKTSSSDKAKNIFFHSCFFPLAATCPCESSRSALLWTEQNAETSQPGTQRPLGLTECVKVTHYSSGRALEEARVTGQELCALFTTESLHSRITCEVSCGLFLSKAWHKFSPIFQAVSSCLTKSSSWRSFTTYAVCRFDRSLSTQNQKPSFWPAKRLFIPWNLKCFYLIFLVNPWTLCLLSRWDSPCSNTNIQQHQHCGVLKD